MGAVEVTEKIWEEVRGEERSDEDYFRASRRSNPKH